MPEQTMLKQFTRYVSLNILGMIALSCYVLADTYFVASRLGSQGLSAMNLALPVYNLIHSTGLMLGIGGATQFILIRSRKGERAADAVFTATLLIGLCIGVVLMALGFLLPDSIAALLGSSGASLEWSATYLGTLLKFAPAFILNNILIAFVRNDGEPHLSMAGMVIGSLSNIVLDYVFMYPFGMGMFGAAFATGLSPVISLCVLSLHFIRRRNQAALCRRPAGLRDSAGIFALGASTFINEMSTGVVLLVFNLVILRIAGETGVAAYGVVANVAFVVTSIFTGVAQGVQPLASRQTARRASGDLRRLNRYARVLSLVMAAGVYLIAFLGTDMLVSVFNSEGDPVLAGLAHEGIRIYFTGFFLAGINIVFSAFLSAMAAPQFAFAASLIRGLIGVIVFVFLLAPWMGMNGVWLSVPCAEAAALPVSVSGVVISLKKLGREHTG